MVRKTRRQVNNEHRGTGSGALPGHPGVSVGQMDRVDQVDAVDQVDEVDAVDELDP